MSKKNTPDDDASLFRSFVKGVTPLSSDKVAPQQKPSSTKTTKKVHLSLRHQASHQDNASYHHNDSFHSYNTPKNVIKKLKQGNFEWQATLDLHGCTIEKAERKLNEFISDCMLSHIERVIIVHGQGKHSSHGSVLKPAVLHQLSNYEAVLAYTAAQARDGGAGATYVLLNQQTQ